MECKKQFSRFKNEALMFHLNKYFTSTTGIVLFPCLSFHFFFFFYLLHFTSLQFLEFFFMKNEMKCKDLEFDNYMYLEYGKRKVTSAFSNVYTRCMFIKSLQP